MKHKSFIDELRAAGVRIENGTRHLKLYYKGKQATARGTQVKRSPMLSQRRSNGNLGYPVNSSLVKRGVAPLDTSQ